MKWVPKPSLFQRNRDSNIYAAKLENILVLDGHNITNRGLGDPNCDFWFLVLIYNDGKNRNGRFIPAGYYKKHFTGPVFDDYVWEDHRYLIHNDFEHYHYVWGELYTILTNNKNKLLIHSGNCAQLPTLGPKNRIKIKRAIKIGLQRFNQ
jgi:hypothetical protein